MKLYINITDEDGTLRERFSIGTDAECSVHIEQNNGTIANQRIVEDDIAERIMDEVCAELRRERLAQ